MTSVPDPVAELENILRYSFVDKSRLRLALMHSSLKQSRNDPSYERLEFLGDRVLGLVIAELMLERFPGAAEGKLAPRLATLVSGATLADVARSLDLGAYILMTDGEAAAGTNARDSVLADCCEAVIGALYLDAGLGAAGEFIRRVWEPLIQDVEPRVAKTELQEWLQGRGLPLPEYTVVDRSGPSHKPEFTVELAVSGRDPVRASGPSKRAAEILAAGEMLELIGKGSE
ncbi:MAG: ribonuclease-3 [Paracoccaceae bacterium]|jgi:ribonuclease-3